MGHRVEIVAGNRGKAWHDEVRLVQFPFRVEQDWPDFGTRFRRLMERLSFSRDSLPYLLAAGFDAVIVNLYAFEAAVAAGEGAVAFEGSMIDLPVVERARRLLARASMWKR